MYIYKSGFITGAWKIFDMLSTLYFQNAKKYDTKLLEMFKGK